MALYHKKLTSLKALEKEKKKLQEQVRRMDEEGMLSLDGLVGKGGGKGSDNDNGGFDLSSLVDMLPISSPITAALVKLVTDRVLNRKRKADSDYDDAPSPKRKSKSILKKAAVEVLGGYLKWKAIELSIKGAKHLLKKRKEQKAYEESLKFPSDKVPR